MNMRVTVEGVETADAGRLSLQADADQVQGFYFGRPLPASEIGADVLKDYRKSIAPDALADTKPRRVRRIDKQLSAPNFCAPVRFHARIAKASSYCSGVKPTRSLPPPSSSTGRLIIEGCASISAIAFFSVRPSLSLSGRFLKVSAGAVDELFPACLLRPSFQLLARDALGLVVVEIVGDALLVEPGARLLHRVAVLDAVDGNGHGSCLCSRVDFRLILRRPQSGRLEG